MEEILLAIQERIKCEAPTIKYVDENSGQLDYYSSRPPVMWPCCLIDLTDAIYTETGDPEHQAALVSFTVIIADMKLTPTSANVPIGTKEKSWKIYNTIEEVHKALNNWPPVDNMSPLIRTRHQRTLRDDGIQEYHITYTAELYE